MSCCLREFGHFVFFIFVKLIFNLITIGCFNVTKDCYSNRFNLKGN